VLSVRQPSARIRTVSRTVTPTTLITFKACTIAQTKLEQKQSVKRSEITARSTLNSI
jgi:hypothetical protein